MQKVNLFLFGFLLFAQAAFGQSINVDESSAVWLFGGVEYGYSSLTTSNPGEFNFTGTQFEAKGFGSYYTSHFVFDGGFGWLYNSLTTNTPEASNVIGLINSSGFLELSALYRFGRHWQVGPTTDIAVGSRFSFTPNLLSTNQIVVFGGLQVGYEVNPDSETWRLRVVARGLDTVGYLDGHNEMGALLGLQIGIPLSAPDNVASTNAPAEAVAPVPQAPRETHQRVAVKPPRPVAQIVLTSEKIHFDLGSAKLSAVNHAYFIKMGQMLQNRNSAWQLLEVSGHTDDRGSHEFNQKLSVERAEAVTAALIEGGADAAKVYAKGYSYDLPIDPSDTPEAWTKNRRVELNFLKVSDRKSIHQGIKDVSE